VKLPGVARDRSTLPALTLPAPIEYRLTFTSIFPINLMTSHLNESFSKSLRVWSMISTKGHAGPAPGAVLDFDALRYDAIKAAGRVFGR